VQRWVNKGFSRVDCSAEHRRRRLDSKQRHSTRQVTTAQRPVTGHLIASTEVKRHRTTHTTQHILNYNPHDKHNTLDNYLFRTLRCPRRSTPWTGPGCPLRWFHRSPLELRERDSSVVTG
jgi:hypothetical protein